MIHTNALTRPSRSIHKMHKPGTTKAILSKW